MTDNAEFQITPVKLHWVDSESARVDLCAHGNIRVTLSGEVLLTYTGPGSLSVSTGALHLMRTLESNHSAESPVAEHLIPHCGHCMYLRPDGKLENIGCPHGLNWWVRHEANIVILEFPEERQYSISSGEWWRAVTSLADAVAAFFKASESKQPEDNEDQKWFTAFWAEWAQLRSSPEPEA
jgi:hypothetical protein